MEAGIGPASCKSQVAYKKASRQVSGCCQLGEREQEDVWVSREVQHEYDGAWGGSRGDVQVVAEAQHISTEVRCVSR